MHKLLIIDDEEKLRRKDTGKESLEFVLSKIRLPSRFSWMYKNISASSKKY
jgi:hypothetical protein